MAEDVEVDMAEEERRTEEAAAAQRAKETAAAECRTEETAAAECRTEETAVEERTAETVVATAQAATTAVEAAMAVVAEVEPTAITRISMETVAAKERTAAGEATEEADKEHMADKEHTTNHTTMAVATDDRGAIAKEEKFARSACIHLSATCSVHSSSSKFSIQFASSIKVRILSHSLFFIPNSHCSPVYFCI